MWEAARYGIILLPLSNCIIERTFYYGRAGETERCVMAVEVNKDTKLRELILYVCLRSEGDQWFGKTKLNKLLYFIDTEAFKQTGKTISGQAYIKKQFGPVPDGMESVLRSLTDTHTLAI